MSQAEILKILHENIRPSNTQAEHNENLAETAKKIAVLVGAKEQEDAVR